MKMPSAIPTLWQSYRDRPNPGVVSDKRPVLVKQNPQGVIVVAYV